MITSHGYQTMSDDGKLDSDLKIVRDIMTDPFGGGSSTGGTPPPSVVQGGGHFTPEDDFDLGPMHMQCMGDEMQGYPHNSYPPPHMMHQQQAHQQAMYQQHHHHHQQMGMQQHWGQQQYMNGGYYDQYNNYGYGQQMYQQHPQMQQQHQPQQAVGIVSGGGPSPGGSHNTPSPNALSESDGDEHSIRNNNVLKRPSPGSDSYGMQQQQQQHLMQQQVGVPHHGHMGPPHHHHIPPHVHPHLHHPHIHPHHHMMGGGHPNSGLMSSGPPVPKKPKVSKRKKKRDPNEPQKPVSAYALFFRDSQASIKAANPNAAFGDVSKIVASMWDGLDPDSKAAYKKRTENAKKDYLKKLAAYRASLVSKGSGPGDGNIGYGGTFAGFSAFGSESNLIHHGHHPGAKSFLPGGNSNLTSPGNVTSATGSPVSSGGYLSGGQPIPPRPPVGQGPNSHPSQMSGHMGHHQAQGQMHSQHHPGNNYMNMHGQVIHQLFFADFD